jgi:hypothetical protein
MSIAGSTGYIGSIAASATIDAWFFDAAGALHRWNGSAFRRKVYLSMVHIDIVRGVLMNPMNKCACGAAANARANSGGLLISNRRA